MAENIVTNANDVDLILEQGSTDVGTPQSMGRIVVDEFTLTREEGSEVVNGMGDQLPNGATNGDVSFNWDFTMMGSDKEVFDMVSTEDGISKFFSITARKANDSGSTQWEYALDLCKPTSEEPALTSGDVMEYSVSGFAIRFDRVTN